MVHDLARSFRGVRRAFCAPARPPLASGVKSGVLPPAPQFLHRIGVLLVGGCVPRPHAVDVVGEPQRRQLPMRRDLQRQDAAIGFPRFRREAPQRYNQEGSPACRWSRNGLEEDLREQLQHLLAGSLRQLHDPRTISRVFKQILAALQASGPKGSNGDLPVQLLRCLRGAQRPCGNARGVRSGESVPAGCPHGCVECAGPLHGPHRARATVDTPVAPPVPKQTFEGDWLEQRWLRIRDGGFVIIRHPSLDSRPW